MHHKVKSHIDRNLAVYYLLFAGFLIRLIFSTFPSFHVDADTNFAWAIRVVETGFGGFYSKDVWTNYTPGMIYVFYILGVLRNVFTISDSSFYIVLKIPSILADVALAYFIYKVLLKNVSQTLAFCGMALYLFNPVTFFNSSIWGAFDAPLTLFVFLSIYMLSENKLKWSSFFLGIAFLVKPQAIAVVPVFGLWVLQNFSIKKILELTVPGLITITILSIPFFPTDPIFGFFKLFVQMGQDYTANSLFAYNTWGIFGFWIDDSTNLWFLSYRFWGILLLAIFWIYFYILFFKRKLDLFMLSTLAFLAFFFLPTRVHERYLFPAIPFLTVVALQYKSKILVFALIFLSIFHTINLYYVYVYYNEIYLNLPRVLYIPGFYESLEENAKLISAISSLIFLLIIITISKLVLSKKHA